MVLKLKNVDNNDYDDGNLSILIEEIEKCYTREKAEYYDNEIGFIADVLYIYDRIPILSGIRDVYLNKDNLPYSIGYISKDEIKKYIHEKNIIMNKNANFILLNQETWYI